MVPGLTERERLIADMQRLEWLCDAVIGPARSSERRPPRMGRHAEAPWMLVFRELRRRGRRSQFRSQTSRFELVPPVLPGRSKL